MRTQPNQVESELIRKAIVARAPIELLGSIVVPIGFLPGAILLTALGLGGVTWIYATATVVMAYLRQGALNSLPRSQVDGIVIDGERIPTRVRGFVNGFVVLTSGSVAYVLFRTHLS